MEQRRTIRLEPTQTPKSLLPRLMREDAPLQASNTLVLMFGPHQAELSPSSRQGVRSWILAQIAQNGLPSLVRFGRRDRPSVYRRDEFVVWLTPEGQEASIASLG
ncbi:hypothetical protein [Gloeobacter kilaueensis]|uniref:Uncharacterized protein n=1 Tax=Gloeobacter kilaueensis (strain ATCC BAA-2537 / CCAP 1431/1 / ULC 316 / JS1) TaxID=1183438 RepID=U5QRZ7_GLOK1|nr:hypothetical protein [Gloeobacter kilaueensis]AGY60394.1 hypothetical protein GKIL_4148 [Gloeobacter kilaueensis JS1]